MNISVDLAQRYRVESEGYIDNTGNGSYHNHYEYYDRLVSIDPTEDDIISYQGKEVCRGRFLGHPNDDKSLYLVKSGAKIGLYEDEQLLMDGENLFIYGDLCVQFDEGTYYIVDLKDNSEITTIDNVTFSGYDVEHKVFAFGDRVYALDGDKLAEYHGDKEVLKFDLPTYDIKAEKSTKRGVNKYESIAKHSYSVAVQNSDGNLLVFMRTSEDERADKQALFELYMSKLIARGGDAAYKGTPQQREEIDQIKQAYSLLYNEDISKQKNEEGLTPFEKLLCSCEYGSGEHFLALRDFYLDDFKKETNTKLDVSLRLDELFSRQDISDDDVKLIADFILRNPRAIYSFSGEEFIKLAKASPEMVVNWVTSSDSYDTKIRKIENLKTLGGTARSLAGEILEKNGIQFYSKEDFVLAPNKEFWEIIKDREFGDPDVAFGRLCKALGNLSKDKDSFSYVTTRKMLIEFMDNNPRYASYMKLNWYESTYNRFLVENGLTQDETIIAQVAASKEKSKTQKSLDAIRYGKRSISLKCELDDIVDFTDCDYVAPEYQLSYGCKTTFLNEMLIYGQGGKAAYALSHGASPFQKIEFFKGKKIGMPFAGVFMRSMKDGFKGVQSLMNEIAENLDTKSGQQIIADIEKSLGQNLRQMPAVAQIMKDMRETFMRAKLEYEKKHKEELEEEQKRQKEQEESRKFKKDHQQELDELDKAYRIAKRERVEDYHILFDGETTFKFGRFSEKLLYTQENIDRVKEEIARLEEHHQLVDEIYKKLHTKDENTGKSLIDRFNALDYNVYMKDEKIIHRQGGDHNSDRTVPYSKDTITVLEEFITKQEEKRRIEQEQEAERQRLLRAQEEEQRKKEEAKAMGLPSDVRIWHRIGANKDCGDGWVIKPDGSFCEPTQFEPKKYLSHDGHKIWEQILPGEVVLSWKKYFISAEHEFEVVYMPKEGMTAAQKEAILRIEEKIQDDWKNKIELSSGLPSPDVGMGWNIAGRKMPLKARRDELPEPMLEAEVKPELKVDEKSRVEESTEPDREITKDDLARLLGAFGRL